MKLINWERKGNYNMPTRNFLFYNVTVFLLSCFCFALFVLFLSRSHYVQKATTKVNTLHSEEGKVTC